ncbi:unnamed protein product, partial [Microthlaspi erraticum]
GSVSTGVRAFLRFYICWPCDASPSAVLIFLVYLPFQALFLVLSFGFADQNDFVRSPVKFGGLRSCRL